MSTLIVLALALVAFLILVVVTWAVGYAIGALLGWVIYSAGLMLKGLVKR